MPIPVSSTVKVTVRASAIPLADTVRVIVPLVVNLIAFVSLFVLGRQWLFVSTFLTYYRPSSENDRKTDWNGLYETSTQK
jgi:hypothetical protein